jgi:hypothetical protein
VFSLLKALAGPVSPPVYCMHVWHALIHLCHGLCSRAAREVKLPQLMLDEYIDAIIVAGMHVACTREAWEGVRRAVGNAMATAFDPAIVYPAGQEVAWPLDQPISLLIRDNEPRGYDFEARVTATGALVLPCMRWQREAYYSPQLEGCTWSAARTAPQQVDAVRAGMSAVPGFRSTSATTTEIGTMVLTGVPAQGPS